MQASRFQDREVRAKFYDLAKELGDFGMWVRLHYVYPYPHVADVIPLMAEGKILPYLDIPFQHASPAVLKNMRRPAHGEKTLERIRGWRDACPDLAIRSTFIVGFPGETEEDFQMLLDWLDEAKIDRAGCFKYEPVKGARSNELGLEQVPHEVKESRWHRFMQRQQKISAAQLQKKVGKRLPVIIDEANGGCGQGPDEIRRPRNRRNRACRRRAARCARATSSRSRSTAPTPMICTAAPSRPDQTLSPGGNCHCQFAVLRLRALPRGSLADPRQVVLESGTFRQRLQHKRRAMNSRSELGVGGGKTIASGKGFFDELPLDIGKHVVEEAK